MQTQEGYIQFNCDWHETEILPVGIFQPMNVARSVCFNKGLVGVDVQGIGFGNLSERIGDSREFLITGTQTGALPELAWEHYCLVKDYDFSRYWMACEGPIRPSSEALTHAAVYAACQQIKVIVHVHHAALWQYGCECLPSTAEFAANGTSALASEIGNLVHNNWEGEPLLCALKGHRDGCLAFGVDWQSVTTLLESQLATFTD